jgi:hypothetical protein
MDREELERQIIQENEKKYHQTEGNCPLMEGQLFQHLGTTANTNWATQIIQGMYNGPPDVNQYTMAFLQACQQPQNFWSATFNHFSQDQYI